MTIADYITAPSALTDDELLERLRAIRNTDEDATELLEEHGRRGLDHVPGSFLVKRTMVVR